MSKEDKHTYVNCKWCKGCGCKTCDNKGQIINPLERLCNMCGEALCPPAGSIHDQSPAGLIDAKVSGDYDSEYLSDLQNYKFSLCEKCLRQLFIQFKIKPEINEYSLNNGPEIPVTWEDDQYYYEARIWRRNDGPHQHYINRLCNIEYGCTNAAIYTVLASGEFTENCACEEHKEQALYAIGNSLTSFIGNHLKPFL